MVHENKEIKTLSKSARLDRKKQRRIEKELHAPSLDSFQGMAPWKNIKGSTVRKILTVKNWFSLGPPPKRKYKSGSPRSSDW